MILSGWSLGCVDQGWYRQRVKASHSVAGLASPLRADAADAQQRKTSDGDFTVESPQGRTR